jgi:uroporphyrin-III C-methyltransferase/precorrin-2 dehydrogenase/sirohydrochlorin ferrochelatase
MDNQIESIIVPGITAASGCSAYAGFPLTHRDFAQSVILATGHIKHDGKLELDWKALASNDRTVVFYMGLNNAQLISDSLQAVGRGADTPVGLIERGTTLQQRTVFTTLSELPQAIKDNDLKPPTMMIVGEVVSIAANNAKKAAQNVEQDTLAQA